MAQLSFNRNTAEFIRKDLQFIYDIRVALGNHDTQAIDQYINDWQEELTRQLEEVENAEEVMTAEMKMSTKFTADKEYAKNVCAEICKNLNNGNSIGALDLVGKLELGFKQLAAIEGNEGYRNHLLGLYAMFSAVEMNIRPKEPGIVPNFSRAYTLIENHWNRLLSDEC